MKKTVALLAVAVMLLGLAACGSEPATPTAPATTAATTQATTQATQATEATQPTVDELGPAATGPARPTGPVNDGLPRGTMSGSTYTNTYAGFACSLDSMWVYMSAAELQEKNSNSPTGAAGGAADATRILDMKAQNVMELTFVEVAYQQADASLTDEQLTDAVAQDPQALIAEYATDHITVSNVEKVQVSFLGQQRTALAITATAEGMPYYAVRIITGGDSGYAVSLTVSSFAMDKTDSILSLFTAA